MGLPKDFNDIIQKHLNVSAAWLPITNNFQLGDYGIISDGVFAKIGNISEFNPPAFITSDGPASSIDFSSSGTTNKKFVAGTQVDVIPEGAVDAKISFSFEKESSFLIKIPSITLKQIDNINQLANHLKHSKDWSRKWKVVHQIYTAVEPLIVSTIKKDTELSFGGDVTALKNLKLGNIGVDMSANSELGLNIKGKEGIIGLGLFKLRLLGGGVNILSEDEKSVAVDAEVLNGPTSPENDI